MWKSITCLFIVLFLFHFSSAQQKLNTSTTIITFDPNVVQLAGQPILIQIQPRDSAGNPIPGCSLAPNNQNPFTATFNSSDPTYQKTDCKSGQFPYTLVMKSDPKGVFLLNVYYQNQLVAQSPYVIQILPNIIYAETSVFFAPQLNKSQVGVNQQFSIQTKDQYGNDITTCDPNYATDFVVAFTQSSGEIIFGSVTRCDNVTGIYSAQYETDESGPSFLTVYYNTQTIKPSPYPINVLAGEPDGPNCNVEISNNGVSPAGEDNTFLLSCTDQFGNRVQNCDKLSNWFAHFNASDDPKKNFPANITNCDNDSGIITFTYNYIKADLYNSYVYYLIPTNQVNTFQVRIVPGKATNITAVGPGVSDDPGNIAGERVSFNISASDIYGNEIPGCNFSSDGWNITSNPQMPPVPNMISNPINPPVCNGDAMESGYVAYNATTYKIYISYQGSNALKYPYNTQVYANVLDGNNSQLELNGEEFGAGENIGFTVTGRDEYNNSITDCLSVTKDDFLVQLVNLNTQDIIVGKVNCTDEPFQIEGQVAGTTSGPYQLQVFYNGSQLSGSPIDLTIIPGLMYVPNTIAIGTGFFNVSGPVVAGNETEFFIQPQDEYSNIITNCTSTYGEFSMIITDSLGVLADFEYSISPCVDGIYPGQYIVRSPAQTLTITVFDSYENITQPINNTGSVQILPGQLNLNESLVQAQHDAIVGANVSVTLTLMDTWGNEIQNCSVDPSEFTIHARLFTNSSIHATGMMNCADNVNYNGSFNAITNGTYIVGVGYSDGDFQVGNITETIVDHGLFYPNNGILTGDGVGSPLKPIPAGTNATFNITLNNLYGYPVPASTHYVNLSLFNFVFNGAQNFTPPTPAKTLIPYSNTIYVSYNMTVAQNYTIIVNYGDTAIPNVNGSTISNASYIHGILNPQSLAISDLTGTNGEGSFFINATDIFGNLFPITNETGINVTLSPQCVNQTVRCGDTPISAYQCNYTASQGGIYCINVIDDSTDYIFQVPDSSFTVIGGTGCSNNDYCSNNGYCFPNSSGDYECNCVDGFTGSNCSEKIKSKYMDKILAICLIVGIPLVFLIVALAIGCVVSRNRRSPNLLT